MRHPADSVVLHTEDSLDFFPGRPFAVLVATLLTLGLLSRSNEITAMRSCGVSLLWMSSPFLLFAGSMSVVLLSFSSTIIPLASEKAEEVRAIQIEQKPAPVTIKAVQPWARISTNSLMKVAEIDAEGKTLRGIRIFYFRPPFQLDRITEAEEARYATDGWVLRNGHHRQFHSSENVELARFSEQPITIPLIPDDFTSSLVGNSETMTFRDIHNYLERFRQEGFTFSRLLTDYHDRMALPLVTVVMVLIGIALSLRRSGVRGGNMTVESDKPSLWDFAIGPRIPLPLR
ncbi:MAG: LptF/LptG family permease [Nitrospira sp.]